MICFLCIYLDSAEQLLNVKKIKIDQLVQQGSIESAINGYSEGLEQYELIKPGCAGQYVEEVLKYINLLGIKAKEKIVAENYMEEYIPYVQTIEEHFGLDNDGIITIEEYTQLIDFIYVGRNDERTEYVLGKLADLSYIQNLPDEHRTYEKKYTNSIKKAEKELGLQEDGIITGDEYERISKCVYLSKRL